jgi:hypothetical protein
MKKSLIFPVALSGLFLGVLTFNSCQKETKRAVSSPQEESESAHFTTKTCAHPIFQEQLVDASCDEGYSCGLAMIPTKNRNRIRWRTATQCNLSQNYVGTSYYTLYKYAGAVPGNPSYNLYNQATTFNCTNANMWYASALLTNSSTFILIVSDASYALPSSIHEQNTTGYLYDTGGSLLSTYNYYSDTWKFTTGSTAGTVSCIIKGPK